MRSFMTQQPKARFEYFEDFDCGPCIKINVYYSYHIKEDLKKLGYAWSATDLAWQLTKYFGTEEQAKTWMLEHKSDLQDDLGCETS